jgi:LysM repeat protein
LKCSSCRSFRLINSRSNNPFAAVKAYLAKRAKKPIFYKLVLGFGYFAIAGFPLFAQASFSSFFTSLFNNSTNVSHAASSSFNSQTVPLLQPAINIDPNPAKGGGDITIVNGAALEADQGPAGTEAEATTPASTQISVYTVHEGDSLSGIAKMFGVSINTIIWANDIKGRVIHPGDILVILPVTGIKYTVAKGDTIASIAKKYKSDAAEIASYNELAGDNSLSVGSTIIIPNGEIPAPTVSTPKKTIPKTGTTAKLHDASGPDYNYYYTWPLVGGVVTQGLHGYNAVDIGAPKNTPILASAAGTVIIAKNNDGWNGGYGNYVVIQHENGTQTLYAHANDLLVSVGDSVSQGQNIGLVGRTGEATGYHLHFEVRGAENPFGN